MRASQPLCATVLLMALNLQAQAQSAAEALIEASAEALGGLERIQSIRNITLIGFGQWAYQFGAGNSTADVHAPQRWDAANDLRRVYDLENDRYQLYERRNGLFPFAGPLGHAYTAVNQVLDGDVAYDIMSDGTTHRIGDTAGQGSRRTDSPTQRRLWMLSNPVTAVRTALDPESLIGDLSAEGELSLVTVVTKEGYEYEIGIDPLTDLPYFVRWVNPSDTFGQLAYTVYFTGYVPFDGVLLPHGVNAVIDYRDISYLKLYAHNYRIDTEIENLAAPPEVAAAPEPVLSPPETEVTELADGVWRITASPGSSSTVFEFEDHLLQYEAYGSQLEADTVIDRANTLVPGKEVTALVVSHHHNDHIGGLRAVVARGITVYSRRGNEAIFRELTQRRAPDFPDALERNWQSLKFVPVDEHLRLSDGAMTVDLYWGRENLHMADLTIAYAPEQRILVEADMATAAPVYQWWGDSLFDAVEHYSLDFEILSPVHLDVMTRDELERFVAGGVQRARDRCTEELDKGNYFPGCPVQSDRF